MGKAGGFRKKFTIEEVRAFCESRGFTLLSEEYVKSGAKLHLICSCGRDWVTTYNVIREGSTCKTCAMLRESKALKGIPDDVEYNLETEYPEVAKEWHPTKNGELTPKDVFPVSHLKRWWLCKDCGHSFYATVTNRTTNNSGCPNCVEPKKHKKQVATVIAKKGSLGELFPDLEQEWDYDKNDVSPFTVSHGSHTKYYWKCPEGHSYMKSPKFRSGKSQTGCPICHYDKSKGERKIFGFLTKEEISFIPQKKFPGCVYINILSFDFYLPDYNLCIEYHGGQHIHPVEFFGGEKQFEIQKIRDEIKRQYCKNNNIGLLEIYEYDLKNVNKILEKELSPFLKGGISV